MKTRKTNHTKPMLDSRASKLFVDQLVFRGMHPWASSGPATKNILSMPGRDWIWERHFSVTFHHLRVNFYGVEQNLSTWKAMSAKAQILSTINKQQKFLPSASCMTVAAYLKSTDQKFDMINLDWMSSWSPSHHDQVLSILNRKLIRKGGLLHIMYSMDRDKQSAWEPLSEHSSDIFGFREMNGGKSEPRFYGIPGLILEEVRQHGINAKITFNTVFSSHSQEPASTISSFVVRF